jgi:hypothetical protein
MANETVIFPGSVYDSTFKDDSSYSSSNCPDVFVGHSPSYGYLHGAFRFPNIPLARNTTVAAAGVVMENIGRAGNSIYAYFCGINEDNTSNFSSNPFGRSETSAKSDQYWFEPSSGSRINIGCAGQLNEILSRGGWNSGNAVGFFLKAKSESSHDSRNNYIHCTSSYLWYRLSAEPNLKPTPVTVVAPTFPGTRGYGLKISKPGVDVKTAANSDLLYTSDKEYMKILAEGSISTTANTQYLIAHGLSYTPRVLAYGRANGKSFELPRLFGGGSDPVGGGLQGFISVDSANIRIFTYINASVYFYVFIDELS